MCGSLESTSRFVHNSSTVWKVLKHDGISAEGHVTMPEFKGDEAQ